MYFSNTVLLQNLEKQNRTKTKLKQYLILLTRILLIVALVTAFSQPYIPVNKNQNQGGKKYTAIYLDNSFSMDGESEKGKMIDAARQLAYDIVSAYPPDMQYFFLTNHFSPEYLQLMNTNEIKENIADVNLTPMFRSLPEVLARFSALAGQDATLNIYVISDMQECNFKSDITFSSFSHHVVLVPITGNLQGNLSVDSCWFNAPVKNIGKADELTVQIKNHSNQPYVDIPVKLSINDTVKTISSLTIEAGETVKLPLTFTNTSSGNIKGEVGIDDYPVTFDNNLFFSYSINNVVNILIINETGTNQYLSALYKTADDNFNYTEVKAGSEKNSEFQQYQLIIANGLKSIPSGLAESFKEYIETGHSLVLIPGEQCDLGSYNSFLSALEVGKISEVSLQQRRISEINYRNYLFKDVFGKIDKNIDLPDINSFYPLQVFSNSNADVVLFDDKSNPLIATNPTGAGKFVFCAIPLSKTNELFMKHPLFVPLFYNMALYSGSSQSLYCVAGRESYIDISGFRPDQNTVLHIVDSLTDIIPASRIIPGGTRITIPETLVRAGHYSVTSGNATHSLISMNYSREESATKYLQGNEIIEELKQAGIESVSSVDYLSENFRSNVAEQSLGTMLWKYFIILALVFVVAEIAIIRLMK